MKMKMKKKKNQNAAAAAGGGGGGGDMQDDAALDPRECLRGLRKAYYFASSNINDDGGDGDGEDDNMENDPEVVRRISQVEENLLQMLQEEKDGNVEIKLLSEEDAKLKCRLESEKAEQPAIPISPLHSKHAFPCSDTYKVLPSPPSTWPQAPLMIRPTPHTSTKIRGIRKSSSVEYQHFAGFCQGCILPINNGQEAPGEALVIDFESTYFVGSLLMRIKQAKSASASSVASRNDEEKEEEEEQDEDEQQRSSTSLSSSHKKSFFHGKKRKFQAIVRGRFRTPSSSSSSSLPMCEMVTGQIFDRPAGKLPARWIVTSFIKFVSTLAPQLEARLDGKSPRFLTPLVATAHTVLQTRRKTANATNTSTDTMYTDLEDEVEELPSTDSACLLPLAQKALEMTTLDDTTSFSTSARMKARKRAFNALAAKKDTTLCFDCHDDDSSSSSTTDYTFEFYQHLLDFGEGGLAVDMGRPIGKVGLSQATDGQPLKFMSAHQDPITGVLDSLWSFDIWHASLYPYAEAAAAAAAAERQQERQELLAGTK